MAERGDGSGRRASGHIDPDDLAVLALDGINDDASRAHLDVCEPCARRYRSFAAVVAHMRDDDGTAPLVSPGEVTWRRIAEAASADTEKAERSNSAARQDGTAGETTDAHRNETGVAHLAAGPVGARRSRWVLRAAMVALMGVVVAVGAVVGSRGGEATVVARATLAALGSDDPAAADGQALLLSTAVGRAVELDLPADSRAGRGDGYYELWLIDEQVAGMVSLGPVTAGPSLVRVPDGLSVDRFPIVDVSFEPFDGDPSHSGASVWRGALSTSAASLSQSRTTLLAGLG